MRDKVRKTSKRCIALLNEEENKKVLICGSMRVIVDILHELGHTDVKSYSVNCFDSKKNDDDDFSLMFIITFMKKRKKKRKERVICSKTFQLGQTKKGTSFEML